jgi:hypothetical protein
VAFLRLGDPEDHARGGPVDVHPLIHALTLREHGRGATDR